MVHTLAAAGGDGLTWVNLDMHTQAAYRRHTVVLKLSAERT